uniref:Uncharacterized protein n=1 Tax=Tanacetum cinerariifolium TaxID=118510 RepID=A0A6L2KSL6_TANCI|nr:hypothetical protein [Tanacetum cinerariifolium]
MENQEQNLPQQEQPFVAAKKVSFNLEDIILNTNNKVALLYPEHTNKEYFMCGFYFISKCCLRKPFTKSPNMYQEYLAEFWYSAKALENSKVSFLIPTCGIYGEVGLNTFRNAISAHYLPHSSEYVAPPSIDVVRKWFPMIRRKESISAMDSNPNQPSVSTPVDTKMHKEDQQATGGPTSLGVTSKERANPQLSNGHDVSVDFTAEADLRLSAPNDYIPLQQGMDEGTKNTSYDHISAGTDPHVLTDQTKSVSKGLETVPTQPTTEKGASSTTIHGDKEEASTAIHGDKEKASNTLKLEDLAKLVSQIQPSFKDLDLPEDDLVIIVDESDKDEPNAKTKDTSKYKLELEKNKAEAKAALLKAQPLFLNVEQLNELLVKSLQTEFLKILSSYNFSNSLSTELKDLPSKFNELTEETKGLKTQVHKLEIELLKELKEIPIKLEDFRKTATNLTSQVAELKTL